MKWYLLGVIIISVAIGLFEVMVSDMHGLRGYIRGIGLLCILVVALSPLAQALSDINDNFFEDIKNSIIDGVVGSDEDYSEMLNEYLKSFSENSYKSEIKRILKEKFDISEEECFVELESEFSDDTMSVTEIRILLTGNAIFKNPYNIEDYFKNLAGCECQVLIKQK